MQGSGVRPVNIVWTVQQGCKDSVNHGADLMQTNIHSVNLILSVLQQRMEADRLSVTISRDSAPSPAPRCCQRSRRGGG